MENLIDQACEACNQYTPRLHTHEINTLLRSIANWTVQPNLRLFKRFNFKNYAEPLKLVNEISVIAEAEKHHPNITFGWGFIEVTIYTHAIDALSKNDFILAAKIDTFTHPK